MRWKRWWYHHHCHGADIICGDGGDDGDDGVGDGDGEDEDDDRSPRPGDLIAHLANSKTSNYCQAKP